MAKIKVESILDHLDRDLTRALADAVRKTIPSATFDANALYRTFVQNAYRQCSIWETVPDHFVDSD